KPLTQLFTYLVPKQTEPFIAVGKRVAVPFGKGDKPAVGYCVELTRQRPERAVKPVRHVLDEEPLLTPTLLKWTRWMADYYLCGWGQVVDAAVPAGVKEQAGTRARPFLVAVPQEQLPLEPPKLSKKQTRALEFLREEGTPVDARKLAKRAECGLSVLWGLVRN